MFGNIVQLTRQLHEGQITVYSIDPPVAGDLDDGFTNGVTHLRPDHATLTPQEFVRRVMSAGMISHCRRSPSEAAAWRSTRAVT